MTKPRGKLDLLVKAIPVFLFGFAVFFGVGVRGFQLPLWPSNMLQFTLALPSGRIFTALRSIFQTSLPVPATSTSIVDDSDVSGVAGSDGDDGDEEDEDDYFDGEEDEWEDPEFDDYEGFTSIEDPDEDGNFEEPEWCEEC